MMKSAPKTAEMLTIGTKSVFLRVQTKASKIIPTVHLNNHIQIIEPASHTTINTRWKSGHDLLCRWGARLIRKHGWQVRISWWRQLLVEKKDENNDLSSPPVGALSLSFPTSRGKGLAHPPHPLWHLWIDLATPALLMILWPLQCLLHSFDADFNHRLHLLRHAIKCVFVYVSCGVTCVCEVNALRAKWPRVILV